MCVWGEKKKKKLWSNEGSQSGALTWCFLSDVIARLLHGRSAGGGGTADAHGLLNAGLLSCVPPTQREWPRHHRWFLRILHHSYTSTSIHRHTIHMPSLCEKKKEKHESIFIQGFTFIKLIEDCYHLCFQRQNSCRGNNLKDREKNKTKNRNIIAFVYFY